MDQAADKDIGISGGSHVSKHTFRFAMGLAAWSAILVATLSIAQWPYDWGHAICGPWGCGPPMQALVSCHLSWFVVLVPAVILLQRSGQFSNQSLRRLGTTLCLASITVLISIVAFERLTWWPMIGESHRAYFWHRCGFEIATMVDVPTLQLFATGAYLRLFARNTMVCDSEPSTALATTADRGTVSDANS
jgi:hypothetical protein